MTSCANGPLASAQLSATLLVASLAAGGKGGGGGGGASGVFGPDFSVNAAKVDGGYPGKFLVLRTGARTNAAGAYTGGGTGNKSILGIFGLDKKPISALDSLAFTWENVVGPGGPFFNPPGAGTVLSPYMNLIIDFAPTSGGDIRVLSLMDDSLALSITAAIGAYSNPGGLNKLTYSWDKTKDVLIVNAPPNPVPGGVTPNISVGATWPDNSYTWADLVAANPDAIFVDVFPNDGGLPAGAIMPAALLISGDSNNVTRSGKKITSIKLNGSSVL
jgi:hypothetical protein